MAQPRWLHVQDFEVDAAFELGLLPPRGPVHDFALRMEKFFTTAFDRVSTISARMIDRARVKGIREEEDCPFFPNWVDVDAIYPLDPSKRRSNVFRRELASRVPGIENKTILLYSGNMGAKQWTRNACAANRGLRSGDPRVHFRICGDGAFRPRLEASSQTALT